MRWSVLSLVVFVVLGAFLLIYIRIKQQQGTIPVVAIMITGKDERRIDLAKKSVNNFVEQTYPLKTLLIINHHPSLRVLKASTVGKGDLFEFHVEKAEGITLGKLRNIALQMVPIQSVWTTWDDDDYRHPKYLELLVRRMPTTLDAVVPITRRIEHNLINHTSWQTTKTTGFVFFLAPFDNRVAYQDKDTMEDTEILRDYAALGYKISPFVNDPKMYIRFVHDNNTSLYVNPKRTGLRKGEDYSERYATPSEKKYIDHVVDTKM